MPPSEKAAILSSWLDSTHVDGTKCKMKSQPLTWEKEQMLGEGFPWPPGSITSMRSRGLPLVAVAKFCAPSRKSCCCSSAATTAKSPQLCPTLCNPTDSSPPGSPVPGILQARTLEWVPPNSVSVIQFDTVHRG